MHSKNSRWLWLLPVLFVWSCAKPTPPAPPFAGNWENTHAMKGGQFITQINFEPSGSGQVQQISHMTGKAAKKIADTAVIRPMHWHSDGDHFVILLYQPEGSGQVRLEWSISNDGKVLSLIHSDNSTDVYYRPGAQGTSSPAEAVRVVPGGHTRETETASADKAVSPATPSVEAGPVDEEKRAEALLEKL